jgi:hypothetical protein
MTRRVLGSLLTILSVVALYFLTVFVVPSDSKSILTMFLAYLLALFLPGLVIDLVFGWMGQGIEGGIAAKCGGLEHGGYIIGYVERSLIFLAIVIAYFEPGLSYASILSFLSVIVAGKAIFRYSSKVSEDRACADWYILGTLMSITMALALTWGIFRFLLAG